MSVKPTVKLLESGYWLVRWSQNLWLQWPKGRWPRESDGFGWIGEQRLREAALITQKDQK